MVSWMSPALPTWTMHPPTPFTTASIFYDIVATVSTTHAYFTTVLPPGRWRSSNATTLADDPAAADHFCRSSCLRACGHSLSSHCRQRLCDICSRRRQGLEGEMQTLAVEMEKAMVVCGLFGIPWRWFWTACWVDGGDCCGGEESIRMMSDRATAPRQQLQGITRGLYCMKLCQYCSVRHMEGSRQDSFSLRWCHALFLLKQRTAAKQGLKFRK